ncbi:MAG: hypothetical protein WC242_00120 [Candidatus Paceibacterota bacterium]|jgi:hypothetical protein
MAEVRQVESLDDVFQRICDRIRSQFQDSTFHFLSFKGWRYLQKSHEYFSFWFIHLKTWKTLVAVRLGDTNVVKCGCYDLSIFRVIEEEMTKYAEQMGIDKIILEKVHDE